VKDLLEPASRRAKAALDAGESQEDVALAIFNELYLSLGMDPEFIKYCADAAKEIMRSLR
jgi:hypothetical protein